MFAQGTGAASIDSEDSASSRLLHNILLPRQQQQLELRETKTLPSDLSLSFCNAKNISDAANTLLPLLKAEVTDAQKEAKPEVDEKLVSKYLRESIENILNSQPPANSVEEY